MGAARLGGGHQHVVQVVEEVAVSTIMKVTDPARPVRSCDKNMNMSEEDGDIIDDLPMDVHLDTLSHIVILDINPSVSTSHPPRDD